MTVEVHGFCDERFAPMRDAFVANFEAGDEIGASLALTHQGKPVVDLWAGHADPGQGRLWDENTIVPVASTTKIMATISILLLIDRGLIDLDAPVSRYWPAFAQGGKAAVTVRDLLSHQAGMPSLNPPISYGLLHDPEALADRLAAEPHWFEGRKVVCYHGHTYGLLVGELVRRIDGRPFRQFFLEELAHRAGADIQIGLTSTAELLRLATVRMPDNVAYPEGLARQVMSTFVDFDHKTWTFQSSADPGGSGMANGRSIARICAIPAMRGQLDGVRYLSADLVDQVGLEQAYGHCPLMGWIRWGLGFGLHSKEFPAPSESCFHWGGFGGSWGVMDPVAGVSLGYAPNNFLFAPVDPRLVRIGRALRQVLGAL